MFSAPSVTPENSLVPRLCLGTQFSRGSASHRKAIETRTRAGSAGRACKAVGSKAEPRNQWMAFADNVRIDSYPANDELQNQSQTVELDNRKRKLTLEQLAPIRFVQSCILSALLLCCATSGFGQSVNRPSVAIPSIIRFSDSTSKSQLLFRHQDGSSGDRKSVV